jgi:hypothetical protein
VKLRQAPLQPEWLFVTEKSYGLWYGMLEAAQSRKRARFRHDRQVVHGLASAVQLAAFLEPILEPDRGFSGEQL